MKKLGLGLFLLLALSMGAVGCGSSSDEAVESEVEIIESTETVQSESGSLSKDASLDSIGAEK